MMIQFNIASFSTNNKPFMTVFVVTYFIRFISTKGFNVDKYVSTSYSAIWILFVNLDKSFIEYDFLDICLIQRK